MKKKEKTLEEQLYLIGLIFLVFGSIAIFIYLKIFLPNIKPIPCMMLEIFGLYCPGCGGTRAVDALLHGQILLSLWYHPLVIYTIVVFGGFMLTHTMEKLHVLHVAGWKFHDWHMYAALIIAIGNWIIKNILLIGFHITL